MEAFIKSSFIEKHILRKKFPCIMAKSLLNRKKIQIHQVNSLKGEVKGAFGVISNFANQLDSSSQELRSLVIEISEFDEDFLEFEKNFWDFLQALIREDEVLYSHDESVSDNPLDSKYSFSISGQSFFIILLHPNSPRLSRRSKKPCIVFNPHHQFENLKRSGKFSKIRDTIRRLDKKLQGFVNPMMADHGESSEIVQYSGRIYNQERECPFHKLIRRKSCKKSKKEVVSHLA